MSRKVPSYNIANVMKLREKILTDDRVIDFRRTTPAGEKFEEFVELIAGLLPGVVPQHAVRASCEHLHGELLTDEEVEDLAWRLAGNLRRLKAGHPVLPWSGIPRDEWMPVQVTAADFHVNRWGKAGALLSLQILAGRACPQTTEAFWTTNYCRFLASRFGFSRFSRGQYPFRDITELMNFRFLVLVQGGRSEIEFEEIAVTSSAKTWNKQYLRMRARELKGFACPRKLSEDKLCFRCPWGLDRCPAAVRPQTLIRIRCGQCGRKKYHDPDMEECCRDCHFKNLRKRQTND